MKYNIGKLRIFLSIFIASFISGISLFLLYCNKDFVGGDAVSLFTLGIVCALLNLIYPKVSTIAIAGMEVKLRKLTIEAEEEIEKLKKTKLKMYQISLGLVMRQEGGWASIRVSDQRVPMMLELLSAIDEDGVLSDLQYSLVDKIEELLSSQIRGLRSLYNKFSGVDLVEEGGEVVDVIIKWRDEYVKNIHVLEQIDSEDLKDLERELIWADEMNYYYNKIWLS